MLLIAPSGRAAHCDGDLPGRASVRRGVACVPSTLSLQGTSPLPLFAFLLLSNVPVPVNATSLCFVAKVARAAARKLALAAMLGRAMLVAGMCFFIIEEAKRLLANSSRAVPVAEKSRLTLFTPLLRGRSLTAAAATQPK